MTFLLIVVGVLYSFAAKIRIIIENQELRIKNLKKCCNFSWQISSVHIFLLSLQAIFKLTPRRILGVGWERTGKKTMVSSNRPVVSTKRPALG
jgi:hypothetical protein